jgi:glycine cleavage system H lipoate-binding protein
MEPLPVDIFATKGIEYLLVLSFLAALVVFWRLLVKAPRPGALAAGSGWFHFPRDAWFHPGHAWARPGPDGLVRVGIDDFAQKLIGAPTAVELPEPGERVMQGARGLRFRFGARAIDVFSPVDGEVFERNEALLKRPELINADPYGDGWLVKIRPERLEANLGNLLHDGSAGAWMAAAEESLRARMEPGLGPVLQDGGVPVTGIARNVFGDGWEDVAADLLLTR